MAATLIVDIGNTSISVARFAPPAGGGLPSPLDTWYQPLNSATFTELPPWMPADQCQWVVGSVNRPTHLSFSRSISAQRPSDTLRLLDYRDLPISIQVDRPDRVGIDRLAAGLAANSIRKPTAGAIVIDTGSAITVDLISRDGAFLGGTISPGVQLSLRSLSDHTDLLPALDAPWKDVPVFGKNTEEAMCAGVFWSAIEAIRGIVARMQSIQPEPCSVIATGGDMAGFLPHLGDDVHFEPHLVLAGLWLASSHGPSEASA